VRIASQIVIACCLLLGGAACAGEAEPPACSTHEATTNVELHDFEFGPACLQAEADATLQLRNAGSASHTFTIDDVDLSVEVGAGDEGSLALDGVTSGSAYTVTCVFHPQMTASLQIT
jgi:plastocyanin